MARSDLCISGDSHIVEVPEIFDGLEQRFGDAAPSIVFEEGRGHLLKIGERVGFSIGRFGVAGAWVNDPQTQEIIKMGYEGLRPGILDPAARLADQDIDGVTHEVLLPSVLFGIYGIENPEIVAATFQNYNDWVFNYASQGEGRLFPTACIPLHDVELGIQELRRAKNLGHVGANIPCVPPKDRPYSDRYYEPFWREAEELDMPLVMHVLTSAQGMNMGLPDWGPIGTYALWPAAIANVIADIICSGVTARHPKLKFVPTEWETGWVGWFLQRLDWAMHRVPPSSLPPEITEAPSSYFHKNFTVTFEDDLIGIMTREQIGVDNLMWGSDYPHHDSIFPRSQQVLDDIFDGVPDEERYAITVANACKLYNLPVAF
jgi:predicted TIM-barrel fold metal-dependent hydrolase